MMQPAIGQMAWACYHLGDGHWQYSSAKILYRHQGPLWKTDLFPGVMHEEDLCATQEDAMIVCQQNNVAHV